MGFMNDAVKEAYSGIKNSHGGPFGSVIVKEGKIVGKGHNEVLKQHDPTCHGEMMAIRDACKNLKTHDLTGCDLYTTAAPCPMCKGAILWANISNVYYGCTIEDTDEIGFRDEIFYENWNKGDSGNYGIQTDRDNCLKLFNDYKNGTHERY
ncbi:MAG: nucleoside deaminase [Eubacterium sp.]|nr:nucleoside deaminase [Eubacterium sp.]